MKLLKINDQIINIDLLTSVNLEEEFVSISVAGEEFEFSGEEAEMLKAWFERYAFDLLNPSSSGFDRALDERPPVEPLRKHLPSGGLFRMPFMLK